MNNFEVTYQSSKSKYRKGILHLPHGDVDTPCFMPDATLGFIKSTPFFNINEYIDIVVMNTLHAYLQLGINRIKKYGGINEFSKFNKPILSDSGGFQVFSMGIKQNSTINHDGIEFVDPRKGNKHFFTPEISIQTQNAMNTDIFVLLDYYTYPTSDIKEKERSIEITREWTYRSILEYKKCNSSAMKVGVVQGDNILELRKKSYEYIMQFGDDIDIIGYGGSPSYNGIFDDKTVSYFADLTQNSPNKARYALGVGTPEDIIKCSEMGFDMFDTVLPTRNARHGYLYTSSGIVRIKNSKYTSDLSYLDEKCDCYTCQNYTKALLRFIYKSKDPLAFLLGTIHNLKYYSNLIKNLDKLIK